MKKHALAKYFVYWFVRYLRRRLPAGPPAARDFELKSRGFDGSVLDLLEDSERMLFPENNQEQNFLIPSVRLIPASAPLRASVPLLVTLRTSRGNSCLVSSLLDVVL